MRRKKERMRGNVDNDDDNMHFDTGRKGHNEGIKVNDIP